MHTCETTGASGVVETSRIRRAAAIVLASVASVAAPAVTSAAVYLVDFNETAGTTGPNGIWNAYATPASVSGGLVDATGAPSPLSIAISTAAAAGQISDSSQPESAVFSNATNTQPSWATSATQNGAAGDYFFTGNSAAAQNTYSVLFSGLTPGERFSFDLLASRNDGAAVGFYDYSTDGGATWTGFRVLNSDGTVATGTWTGTDTKATAFAETSEGFTNHRYMNVEDVLLTGSTLQVRVTDANATTSTYSTINAMRLTVAPVPEPGSVALLGLGGVALLARRRRA